MVRRRFKFEPVPEMSEAEITRRRHAEREDLKAELKDLAAGPLPARMTEVAWFNRLAYVRSRLHELGER
jgi:hypothetical protein